MINLCICVYLLEERMSKTVDCDCTEGIVTLPCVRGSFHLFWALRQQSLYRKSVGIWPELSKERFYNTVCFFQIEKTI